MKKTDLNNPHILSEIALSKSDLVLNVGHYRLTHNDLVVTMLRLKHKVTDSEYLFIGLPDHHAVVTVPFFKYNAITEEYKTLIVPRIYEMIVDEEMFKPDQGNVICRAEDELVEECALAGSAMCFIDHFSNYKKDPTVIDALCMMLPAYTHEYEFERLNDFIIKHQKNLRNVDVEFYGVPSRFIVQNDESPKTVN